MLLRGLKDNRSNISKAQNRIGNLKSNNKKEIAKARNDHAKFCKLLPALGSNKHRGIV